MPNPAPGYAAKPEHRVDLLPETRRVRVSFAGTVIADSSASVRVEETGHGPVHYVPEKDVRLDLMRPTEHKTYCPFKGDCSYWTIEIESVAVPSASRKTPSGPTVRPMMRRRGWPGTMPSTRAASMRSRCCEMALPPPYPPPRAGEG